MITEINIIPVKEVNGIAFGADRQQVRSAFGKYKEFKKTPFSSNTTDDFGSFHVFYDEDNKFQAIEVFDDATVKIDDEVVFPGGIDCLQECIGGFVEEDGYYTNYELSIGASLSDGKLESLCFGCKGYYTDEN